MRIVLHLGTRAGPATIDAALKDHLDPVTILVPADERLLGPNVGVDAGDLEAVIEVVRSRALEHATEAAERSERELTDVFGSEPEGGDRVVARLLDPPLEDGLADVLDEQGSIEELFAARDALEILDEAGIRLEGVLDARGVDLVTR